MNIQYSSSHTIRGFSATQDYIVHVSKELVLTDVTVVHTTKLDCNVRTETAIASTPVYTINIIVDPKWNGHQLECLTPDVATITNSGKITYVADGTARIKVTAPFGTRIIDLPMAQKGGEVVDFLESHIPGTLGANIDANIAALFDGKLPGPTTQDVYLNPVCNTNPLLCSGSLNPTSVLHEFDVSYISFATASGHHFPAMLVSNRHAIMNTHIYGNTHVYRKTDGTFVKATVKSATQLSSDMTVVYYNEDLSDIVPMRVLDSSFKVHTPTLEQTVVNGVIAENYLRIPAIIITANPSAYLQNTRHVQVINLTGWGYKGLTNMWSPGITLADIPESSPLYPFYSAPYPGDSGSPVLLPITIAGETHLYYVTSLYSAFSGPSTVHLSDAIETAMNDMASQAGDSFIYSLHKADLSAFSSF